MKAFGDKPFAPACERNRDPILAVLRERFADRREVLEIGSGTGQHAVHFAAAMPWLRWRCSDVEANLPGIRAWLDEAALPNLPPPFALEVTGRWPALAVDAVFSANTLHIMGWDAVRATFAALPAVTVPGAVLAVYGPFNEGGRFTGPGNAAFDAQLRAAYPARGLRDVEAVDALARQAGFALLENRAMPADNRCLVWRRGDG
jgi:cyclopropane fatty-acyl-phospholipid synthase-like methyltransferase